ncbi:3-hydroxy-fatty acyl-ACP dehydratase [Wohlfahrtiimonas chitiniclastica]|uniref:ApeP family dehydratase n=1 Tax=Wohlfahrtiimonas chitiniclastica TaxID=400946 RepID=UPI001BCE6F08|nr:3-hydroxy-fatty acyl-ACP dehydratase [Wohlfahrtiimonas chitiniclastica]MBS7836213.1 3-hydroxy-fatty acyl-ACP dehydratase [Wohlfahrtiimonas chitiniclastica]
MYQAIEHYLPHKAPMILLDHVVDCANDFTRCEVTVTDDGVLAPFLTTEGLPAWFFVEIMAQTVGVWNGLRLEKAERSPAIALLLGIRNFITSVDYAARNDHLIVRADMVLFDEVLSNFKCELALNGSVVASANIVAYEASHLSNIK